MRSSCNGCRALRKACVDGCAIRPCLGWIGTPEAEANATVFLAKFYGRAGLLNLLAAAPDDAHRPALFRSLLYEACGRAANPVYGAAGLFSSGNWEACKDALLAVLHDRPIAQVDPRLAVPHPGLLLAHDFLHADAATNDDTIDHAPAPVTAQLLGVSRAGRTAFKRASSSSSTARPKSKHNGGVEEPAGSHGHVEDGGVAMAGEQTTRKDSSSSVSVSHVSQAEQSAPVPQHDEDDDGIGLELTLGFGPAATRVSRSPPACFGAGSSSGAESGHMGLMLGLPV